MSNLGMEAEIIESLEAALEASEARVRELEAVLGWLEHERPEAWQAARHAMEETA